MSTEHRSPRRDPRDPDYSREPRRSRLRGEARSGARAGRPEEGRNGRPLPREVYIRRRVAAVVVLVVLIGLLWWAIAAMFGGGSDSENAAATQATSTSPNMKGPVEPPQGNSSKASDSATSSSSASASSEPKAGNCSPADLQVEAVPGAPVFGADQQPNFFAKITNPTGRDCELNMEDSPLKFEVFRLNDYQRVWSDLDCNDPEVTGNVKFPAGKTTTYELTSWSRTSSVPGNCGSRDPVPAGAYLLYTHVGDTVSQPATFNLG
ncbi:hypothetical protein [Corynebacterium heidelbergense]|uniref:hypothetical protein n=1 Tax=Corynebacterium heidelbergense TaxID=2055947 RepID=UPI001EE77BE9|nr:hypothetical protein [Corynebacterium heidelbergense]